VWDKRKKIILITFLFTSLVAAGTFLLSTRFTSTSTLIPTTSGSEFGSIADLAGLAGFNLNLSGQDLTMLYPDIILSEEVLREVIYRRYKLKDGTEGNLVEIFENADEDSNKAFEETLAQLAKKIKITMDKKTLMMTLLLEERESQLTADILNETVNQLDIFLRKKRNTSASEQRKFIENRLHEISGELTNSENALQTFREKNRSIGLSPALMLQEQRLLRDVTINNAIFLELKKQYEMVKIEEVKNIPIINVLDKARPASQKSFPVRKKITFLAFLVILVAVSTFFVYQERMYGMYRKYIAIIRTQADPE
jgi:uncharacterized protein involved in exopolysaccharide biosynthesis